MKKFLDKFFLVAAFVCMFAGVASAQNVVNYNEQGGAKTVIGGTLQIDSGATFTHAGVAVPVLRTATDAIASGQTSKAVTVTGVTTASECVASANEVATNSVSIRAAVPTANTVTVHSSGDPGASNLDLTVICAD